MILIAITASYLLLISLYFLLLNQLLTYLPISLILNLLIYVCICYCCCTIHTTDILRTTRFWFYTEIESLSLSLSLDKNDTNQRLMLNIIYETNPRWNSETQSSEVPKDLFAFEMVLGSYPWKLLQRSSYTLSIKICLFLYTFRHSSNKSSSVLLLCCV